MSLHDEEMKKRREKREAQRRRQEAERRRLRRRLMLAILLLAAVGVGIWLLTRNAGVRGVSAASPEQTAPVETQAPTESEHPLVQDPITTVHLKAAGDLVVTDDVIQAGVAANGYDFSKVFQDVVPTLADADLTVMNFEGNVYGENYGTATSCAPPRLLQDLRSAGVDMLQMANSCVINNGLIGMESTLNAIRDAGMEPLGAFANEKEFKTSKGYTITDVRGVKIAFVAFTKGMGGRGMPAGKENLVNLLYTDYATSYQELDKTRIETILKNVAAEKPDLTVAMVHWGSEYNETISETQEALVTILKKQGVDVILGTHPHTFQTIDYDQEAGTLVVYSLGDFFSDAQQGATNYSIILDVEITKDATTGTTKVTGYDYTPIYTVKDTECGGFQKGQRRVVRVDKTIEAFDKNFLDKVTPASKSAMEYALTRIEERKLTQEQKDELAKQQEEQEKQAKG
ncbi:MAG: CapA family protein [Eubacteriales bacterium]|nr:CapA family protein [Eubacteriales bacterium]